MEEETGFKEVQTLVSQCTGSILYIPTTSEVDVKDPSFPLDIHTDSFITLPQDKHSDPFEWAEKCIEKFKNDPVCVFVPGTRFDMYGTRHGKGAGWYDRFLSRIPSHWLRIGIIDSSKFSHTQLVRQEWDEPVHWVIVKNDRSWKVYKVEQ